MASNHLTTAERISVEDVRSSIIHDYVRTEVDEGFLERRLESAQVLGVRAAARKALLAVDAALRRLVVRPYVAVVHVQDVEEVVLEVELITCYPIALCPSP